MRPIFSFRLAGIPVHVQPGHLLMGAVFAFAAGGGVVPGLVTMAVVSASILWHELGHALTMRAFGYPPSIELVAMGGLAHWPEGADPRPKEALLVSAAGPGAQLALGGALLALTAFAPPLPRLAASAVATAIFVNIGWALFNLLPIMPLDGSHICEHATRWVTGVREPRWVGWASLLAGSAVVAWAVISQSMWLGFIGGMGAVAGFTRIRSGQAGGRRGGAAAARQKARLARSRGDLRALVAALLPPASVGALPEPDLADLVGALVRTGREAEVVALVQSRLKGFARRRDAAPLAQLAVEGLSAAGAHEEAAAVAQLAFQQLAVPQYAYEAAIHLAALARHDDAMTWLGRAAEAGLPCGTMMLSDPALEPLRGRADFFEMAMRAGAKEGAA